MFGKKAKEIEFLNSLIDTQMGQINMLLDEKAAIEKANANQAQMLKNAQALIQRAEADRDAQKRRADENYALYTKEKERADSLVVPFTAVIQAEADGFEPPKPKKKR